MLEEREREGAAACDIILYMPDHSGENNDLGAVGQVDPSGPPQEVQLGLLDQWVVLNVSLRGCGGLQLISLPGKLLHL